MSLVNLSFYDYAVLTTFSGLIIAVIALFLLHRRDQEDIELSKKGLVLLVRLVESFEKPQESQVDRRKVLLQLERWKSRVRESGWHLDYSESEPEEQRQPVAH